MKPQEVRLECRAGNWVATEDGYTFRPATKPELYLWLKLLELQKESVRVFDVRGLEVLKDELK
jgi:hypothetical protein